MMRLRAQEIYAFNDKEEARKEFKKLIRWMKLSRLEPMKKVAKTLEEELEYILNYYDSRLTNATLEGINSVIQNIKGSARGFRNVEYFKAIIYLYSGDFKVEVFDKEDSDNKNNFK